MKGSLWKRKAWVLTSLLGCPCHTPHLVRAITPGLAQNLDFVGKARQRVGGYLWKWVWVFAWEGKVTLNSLCIHWIEIFTPVKASNEHRSLLHRVFLCRSVHVKPFCPRSSPLFFLCVFAHILFSFAQRYHDSNSLLDILLQTVHLFSITEIFTLNARNSIDPDHRLDIISLLSDILAMISVPKKRGFILGGVHHT